MEKQWKELTMRNKDHKSEALNPKFETNYNVQNYKLEFSA